MNNGAFLATVLSCLGCASSIVGCSKPPPATAAPHGEVFRIDYSHQSGGLFYHGRASLIGTNGLLTCDVGDGTTNQSRQVSLSEEAFWEVWDSLNEVPEFQKGKVTAIRQDPRTVYQVQAVSVVRSNGFQRLYEIPADTISPGFKEWLRKVGYTGE